MERELRPETPIAQRCKALKDLGEAVSTNRLEDVSFFFPLFLFTFVSKKVYF